MLLFVAGTVYIVEAKENSNSIYIIKNVPVKATSTNANKAKEIAIKDGQRKSLKALFEKAGINVEYTKFINDSLISEMVETIKIDDEIMTNNSYSSRLTILFNKDFLNFNLKKISIDVGKITNNVFLYIPVFKDEYGNIDMLDSKNTWYESAYNEYFENSNKYENIFIIDNYSLSNSGLLSKKNIDDMTYEFFQTLLSKYNSNTVMFSIAKYNKEDDVVEIKLLEIDAENRNEKNLQFSNKNDLQKHELIKEASIKTLEFLNNESKQRVIDAKNNDKHTAVKKENYMDVFYIIPNIREYVYIKSLLDNLDFVVKYDILQLTTKMANIRIYYKVEESEIIPLFNNKGFSVNRKSGKFFIDYKGL